MIDISIYKQRLENLRELLIEKIDSIGCYYIDMNNVPQMPISEIFKLYFETNIIWVQKQ